VEKELCSSLPTTFSCLFEQGEKILKAEEQRFKLEQRSFQKIDTQIYNLKMDFRELAKGKVDPSCVELNIQKLSKNELVTEEERRTIKSEFSIAMSQLKVRQKSGVNEKIPLLILDCSNFSGWDSTELESRMTELKIRMTELLESKLLDSDEKTRIKEAFRVVETLVQLDKAISLSEECLGLPSMDESCAKISECIKSLKPLLYANPFGSYLVQLSIKDRFEIKVLGEQFKTILKDLESKLEKAIPYDNQLSLRCKYILTCLSLEREESTGSNDFGMGWNEDASGVMSLLESRFGYSPSPQSWEPDFDTPINKMIFAAAYNLQKWEKEAEEFGDPIPDSNILLLDMVASNISLLVGSDSDTPCSPSTLPTVSQLVESDAYSDVPQGRILKFLVNKLDYMAEYSKEIPEKSNMEEEDYSKFSLLDDDLNLSIVIENAEEMFGVDAINTIITGDSEDPLSGIVSALESAFDDPIRLRKMLTCLLNLFYQLAIDVDSAGDDSGGDDKPKGFPPMQMVLVFEKVMNNPSFSDFSRAALLPEVIGSLHCIRQVLPLEEAARLGDLVKSFVTDFCESITAVFSDILLAIESCSLELRQELPAAAARFSNVLRFD